MRQSSPPDAQYGRAPKEGAADKRRRHERAGRLAEWVAAALLLAKGYRILARRVRTPAGEIDLIAVRGRRLAFVEVKLRQRLELAGHSVGPRQARRLARAAEHWVWRHPSLRGYVQGLDVIHIVPWRLPRHLPDALQPK